MTDEPEEVTDIPAPAPHPDDEPIESAPGLIEGVQRLMDAYGPAGVRNYVDLLHDSMGRDSGQRGVASLGLIRPGMPDVPCLDLDAIVDDGYLQEANRMFFHPLGLALEYAKSITVTDPSLNDGKTTEITLTKTFFARVWDYRDDPEGMRFGDGTISVDKADSVAMAQMVKRPIREELLGYWIQPAPKRYLRFTRLPEDAPVAHKIGELLDIEGDPVGIGVPRRVEYDDPTQVLTMRWSEPQEIETTFSDVTSEVLDWFCIKYGFEMSDDRTGPTGRPGLPIVVDAEVVEDEP